MTVFENCFVSAVVFGELQQLLLVHRFSLPVIEGLPFYQPQAMMNPINGQNILPTSSLTI